MASLARSDIDRYAAARLDRSFAGRVRASVLHQDYLAWAEASGATHLTSAAFGRALRSAGFRKVESNGIYYVGVELRR